MLLVNLCYHQYECFVDAMFQKDARGTNHTWNQKEFQVKPSMNFDALVPIQPHSFWKFDDLTFGFEDIIFYIVSNRIKI